MREKLEKQADYDLDINTMSPLRKFIKCFYTFLNRCIEMPEIFLDLLNIGIMEHSDII